MEGQQPHIALGFWGTAVPQILAENKIAEAITVSEMAFLQKILAAQCDHRFTWPRVDAAGQHYQICVTCGTAYVYDWDAMRRTNRLLLPAEVVNKPQQPALGH